MKKYLFHIFAILVIVLVSILQGFYIDKGDLDTYIPFVLHAFNPNLFSNDLLLQTLPDHPVYIWKLFGYLLNFVNLQMLFISFFCIQITLTIFALIYFFRHFISKDTKALYLFLSFLILPTSTVALGRLGINPYEYFHASALAASLVLFILVFLDQKRWVLAGFFAGLIFLFHPITACFTFLIYCFSLLLSIFKDKFSKRMLLGFFTLLLVASPSILAQLSQMFHRSTVVDIVFWRSIVEQRMAHGFFITKWPFERFVEIFVFSMVIFSQRKNSYVKRLLPIILTLCTSFLLLIIADLFTIKFFLQIQIGRMFIFLWLIGYAIIATVNIEIWTKKESQKKWIYSAIWMLLATYACYAHKVNSLENALLAVSIIFIIISALVVIWKTNWKLKIVSLLIPLFLLVTINIYTYLTTFDQSVDSKNSDWRKVQEWCKINVPIDDVVMTPIYLEGFRCYSERSIYVTFKDGAPHNFSNKTFPEWVRRIEALGIKQPFNKKSFRKIYNENCIRTATKEGIKFVVFELQNAPEQNVNTVYKNNTFGVVKLN